MTVHGYKYGRVPEALLYSTASDRACRLHAVLTRWADTRPGEHPTREQLAGLLHCSIKSVYLALQELIEAGFVRVVERFDPDTRGRLANAYILEGVPDPRVTHDPGGGVTGDTGGLPAETPQTPRSADPDPRVTHDPGPRVTHDPANRKKGSKRTPEEGTTSAAKPRPEVEELCALLAGLIVGNGANKAKYDAKATSEAWLREMRLLLDKDLAVDHRGNTVAPAERVARARRAITWAQGNTFWRKNILSPESLRRNYDALRLAATEANGNGHGVRNGDGRRQGDADRDREVASTQARLAADADSPRARRIAELSAAQAATRGSP